MRSICRGRAGSVFPDPQTGFSGDESGYRVRFDVAGIDKFALSLELGDDFLIPRESQLSGRGAG